VWLLVVLVLVAMMLYWGQNFIGGSDVAEVTFEEYEQELAKGDVESVVVEGMDYTATLRRSATFASNKKPVRRLHFKHSANFHENLYDRLSGKALKEKNPDFQSPKIEMREPSQVPLVLWNTLPLIGVAILFYIFFVRQLRTVSGPGNVLSFARSRARLVSQKNVKTTFDDVAGIDEAKEEVKELIEFLKDPKRFRRLGARVPRGILLVGPPGTGKTLLAKAIAGEADVPFLAITGSDFVEMFVGVGAARVRDLFEQARSKAPCVIFLDEIDAVGRRRGTGLGGGHDEREQTLNQILSEMDGFETDESVIVVAATNRPDVLDPALMRPGRFDRQVVVDLPDVKGREAILKVHARKIKTDKAVDLKRLARMTPMFSGASLEEIINEAAIIATVKRRDQVEQQDLEEARDKVLWGRARKSRVVEEEERRTAAYHEAGHALVAKMLPECDPVHKVTIIPRGNAGGMTMSYPEKDLQIHGRKKLEGFIAQAYGGRVAEEMVFGDVSVGAHDDIKKATELARRMVCDWGMSDELGPISYGANEEHLFLGREIARSRDHSEAVASRIDEEIRKIISRCYTRAREVLAKHRRHLDAIAEALLKYETLVGEDLDAILEGRDLDAIMREREAEEARKEKAAEARRAAEQEAERRPPEATASGTDVVPGPSRA
jgi:cell division protease FtsH